MPWLRNLDTPELLLVLAATLLAALLLVRFVRSRGDAPDAGVTQRRLQLRLDLLDDCLAEAERRLAALRGPGGTPRGVPPAPDRPPDASLTRIDALLDGADDDGRIANAVGVPREDVARVRALRQR